MSDKRGYIHLIGPLSSSSPFISAIFNKNNNNACHWALTHFNLGSNRIRPICETKANKDPISKTPCVCILVSLCNIEVLNGPCQVGLPIYFRVFKLFVSYQVNPLILLGRAVLVHLIKSFIPARPKAQVHRESGHAWAVLVLVL